MAMLTAGSGGSSSGRTYGCATPAANGSADDRARHGASPYLCDSVSGKHGCRKAKQQQQN
jgi:hypothetical protein